MNGSSNESAGGSMTSSSSGGKMYDLETLKNRENLPVGVDPEIREVHTHTHTLNHASKLIFSSSVVVLCST